MIKYIPLKEQDANLIHTSWGCNPHNFKYLSSCILATKELAHQYILSTLGNPSNTAYHIKVSGTVVGLVKAKIEAHRATVGYVIDKAYWGKGYATHAVSFITEQLANDSNIQRISATCSPNNAGSIKVLEKAGFQQEAILKSWVIYPSQGQVAHDNYSFIWQKYNDKL